MQDDESCRDAVGRTLRTGNCPRELVLNSENVAISATTVDDHGIGCFRALHYALIFLFMISGAAALIYQVCWQRLLFEGTWLPEVYLSATRPVRSMCSPAHRQCLTMRIDTAISHTPRIIR
jgi:hypothetical protein